MHEVLTRVLKVHVVPDNRFRLAWSSCTSRIPTTSLPGRISAHTATNLAKWKRNGSRNRVGNKRGTTLLCRMPVHLEPRAHEHVRRSVIGAA